MYKRKAIVSLNILALLLFLFLLLFSFFLINYNLKAEQAEDLILKKELLVENINFKTQLIQILSTTNSTTTIKQNLYYPNFEVFLENSKIIFQTQASSDIEREIQSLYGARFCQPYNTSLVVDNTFLFNGTCISLLN